MVAGSITLPSYGGSEVEFNRVLTPNDEVGTQGPSGSGDAAITESSLTLLKGLDL